MNTSNHYDRMIYPASYGDDVGYIMKYMTTSFVNASEIKSDIKSVLVIGCGWAEATQIAYHNTHIKVTGIDSSVPQLLKANSLKRTLSLENLTFINSDIMSIRQTNEFDVVIATGVLHHVYDVRPTLSRIRSFGKPGSIFSGMVYSSKRRFVDKVSNTFRQLGLSNENIDDVEYVTERIRNHTDPRVRHFYFRYSREKEEIIDTWMHYYARSYSKGQFNRLLMKHDFYPIKCYEEKEDPNKLLFTFVNGK